MNKQKLMDNAYSTARQLSLRRSQHVRQKPKDGPGSVEIKVEPFHTASFMRGVEFAYYQIYGSKK